ELPEPDLIPAGVLLDTEPVDGERCRYRTSYPVALHPIRVRRAALMRRPFQAPAVSGVGDASACLHLTLESTLPDLPFAQAAPR
ncbi:type VI secretion system baseplate subunit TssF, partial [Escherichia coli]|uniref:type VI secretion system baseplate subunit TssF n=1 Tax=Escherichia coli TaxID=562 RepID=UPI0014004E59